ncbi:Uncharacterised protein [Mycobacteroides abscessus subsp. abscessus]|nr:Uncharacterised protein [Mycobacteroides abscessus subsp. abscessus]
MTRSPSDNSSDSSAIVCWVIGPDGTITQTTRGASRASASPFSDGTSVTSGRGSYPITSWPPARNRSRMLKPILPSPTKPSCMTHNLR